MALQQSQQQSPQPQQPRHPQENSPASPSSSQELMDRARQVLKDYFGHPSFRPNQQELIEALFEKRDILGVMPTGAGKSLIYQVPALVQEGLTLVISPLISLMKDQVNALSHAGVPAAFLNSSLTAAEQTEALSFAASGTCKLLYVAPERLDEPRFVELCRQVPLSLVAVDEAHCVSQWGQDFRPSYLSIATFLESLPVRPPLCALTATATPTVQQDIVKALNLYHPYVCASGFDRKNLYFGVERPLPKNKLSCLERLVRERAGQSGIIYCSTRNTVEELCTHLQEEGITSTCYHAGLSAAERHAHQDDFLFDRASIMVATNAFGMGIDKSNVSFVIHYAMPGDLESYYQEAGRAGRDGQPADCILIYNKKDVQTCQFFIDKNHEDRIQQGMDIHLSAELYERDRKRLQQMVHYCTTTDCLRAFILQYFGEHTTPFRCEHCSNCTTEFTVEDVTIDAQKIISCVLRIAQRNRQVGKALIVDILHGSKSERVLGGGYDTLSTYNIMDKTPVQRIRYILDALEAQEYLATIGTAYPVIQVTPEGQLFLKERHTFEIKVPQRLPKEEQATAAQTYAKTPKGQAALQEGDEALFTRLKEVRYRLAAEEGVPAYIVFSNATLVDMCAKRPTTEEEFLDVSGVGKVKAQRYSEVFLACIKEYEEE